MHTSELECLERSHVQVAPPDDDRTLLHEIEHAAHYLPTQGPIGVFVHHNTLHTFENLSFDEGVERGGRLFGCEPYLSESRYRAAFLSGRIAIKDLMAVLDESLGRSGENVIGGLITRRDLRRTMLQSPLSEGTEAELRWMVAEADAMKRFRVDVSSENRIALIESTRRLAMGLLTNSPDRSEDANAANGSAADQPLRRRIDGLAVRFRRRYGADIEAWRPATWEAFTLQLLWKICCDAVRDVPHPPQTAGPPIRHRDWLREVTGEDSDAPVNDLLITFCGAFVDQGVAAWEPPGRARGFFASFCETYAGSSRLLPIWASDLARNLQRWQRDNVTPLQAIRESLEDLEVDLQEREEFLTATLLALRGWSGMIWQLETRADEVRRPVAMGSLVGYLAIRLLLERLALASIAQATLDHQVSLAELRATLQQTRERFQHASPGRRAFVVFELAQRLGWSAETLDRLTVSDWTELVEEIESFRSVDRRRLFQTAYEQHYLARTFAALKSSVLKRQADPDRQRSRPRFQAVFCIDDREESYRRHLEELCPDAETFGAAGFFSVAMHYRGAADAEFAPLCPAVVRPKHWVDEHVAVAYQPSHQRRKATRWLFGQASHTISQHSRSGVTGAVLAAGFGWLATIPMTARVLSPRLTAMLRWRASALLRPPAETFLTMERGDHSPGPEGHGLGFRPSEMADIVERTLQDIGLVRNFAPLVLFVGHGSGSANNPHASAYNCGACGGGRGGPNARAFAMMANDPQIRSILSERGIVIPDDVHFVGGYHDTCTDRTDIFDPEQVPTSHQTAIAHMKGVLSQASERNAHERCRRFVSAPLDLTPKQALNHVENRAEDLAQVRPELGHATNASCYVGRRARTRGLFMDRRAFLTSYDAAIDDDQATILGRILGAVVPVCGGISLEYYFSHVDPSGYGCSTKLPHNLSGFLGVMDGAASDLRTGLPWQMVEIHEPMRLVFVIEASETALRQVIARDANVRRAIEHQWCRFALQNPATGEIKVYHKGQFIPDRTLTSEIPTVAHSIEVYRGQRDHLNYHLVTSGLTPEETVTPNASSEALR